MAADTNVNARNDYPPESMSYCGVCVCMHVCMHVPYRYVPELEEKKERRKNRASSCSGVEILSCSWSRGGIGVRGWKMEKNKK